MEQQLSEHTGRRSFSERFPRYVWICAAYLLTIDLIVFYGTRPILAYLPAHDLSTPLDQRIPVLPVWITVYFAAFIPWIITLPWVLSESKRHAYRLCGVYTIIMIATLICFLGYPVTIARPEITGDGIFDKAMRLLYRIDSPMNLCPSLHVVLSYLCWRCTMDCQKIPKWYQWFNLVFLIPVCLSILFVKQHFVVDIAVALIVSEGALQIGRAARLERIGFAIETRFRKKTE